MDRAIVLSLLEYVNSEPHQHNEILYDNTAILMNLKRNILVETKKYSDFIEKTTKEITKLKKMTQVTREEKVQVLGDVHNGTSAARETEKHNQLARKHEMLEEALVQFKLNIANNKSELENAQDDLEQTGKMIKSKDAEINRLLNEIEQTKQEKFCLMLNGTKSVRNIRDREGFAFLKKDIQPCPSSMPALNWGLDREKGTTHSMNSSFIDDRLTLSRRTGASSRYSDHSMIV